MEKIIRRTLLLILLLYIAMNYGAASILMGTFPSEYLIRTVKGGYASYIIAKNYLERVKVNSGKDVVRAIHSPDNKYLEDYYQNWLNQNKETIKNYGYELLDFIHWEQDISNFAGQNTHYANHYVNLFSIFNSREIIKIMFIMCVFFFKFKNIIKR